MEKIEFNLNDMVEFTLTQEGADTINAHRENLLIELGRLDELNKKKYHAGETIQLQLWVMAGMFDFDIMKPTFCKDNMIYLLKKE